MSVGKLLISITISVRPGRSATAAINALCRLIDVLSHAMTVSGAAPIIGAILLPIRKGIASQSSFHERIRRSRHSTLIVWSRTSRDRIVIGPRELPSKYTTSLGISNSNRMGANESAASKAAARSANVDQLIQIPFLKP